MEQNNRHDKSVDLDVTPDGPYADQRPYPPKKKSSARPIWIGIAVVAVIIAATCFIFGGSGEVERTAEAPALVAPGAEPYESELPGKAPDAVSFSPSPEMNSEEASSSPDMVAATSAPGAAMEAEPVRGDEDKAETAKPTPAKPAEKKPEAVKPAPAKPAEKKAEAKKPAPAKPAEKKAENAKPAPAKPAEKTAEAAKPAEKAPAAGSEAAEVKVAEARPAVEAGAPEAKTAEAAQAVAEAGKASGGEAAAGAAPAASATISDQWVVNISSTPDAAESLRLLTRVMSRRAAGEKVYAYETTINGVPHHRIRIGFFATRAEAEAVGQKIKDEYHLSATPWAVQPTTDEVAKFK